MKVDLNKWYRCKIDDQIYKELLKKSDWQGIKHIFVFFTSLFICGGMAYYTWGSWWAIFWFFLYGTIYSCGNPIWHETGHKTAFKSKLLNEIFYQIGSFMTSFEPTRWHWSHFRHHGHTLFTDPLDFEAQVQKPTDLFFILCHVIPFGLLFYLHRSAQFESLKHALGITTPVMEECIPKRERSKCRWISRIHITIWLGSIILSLYFKSWLPVLFILLPNFYGKTLFEIFGIIQHAGLLNNSKDHRLSTRDVYLNPIFSFLYWHMEYHIEHHMYPMIPSFNLKKLHALIKYQLPPAKKNLWDAYKEIIPAILKQAKNPNYKIDVQLPNTKLT